MTNTEHVPTQSETIDSPDPLLLTEEERQTGKVYGDTFSLYDLGEFENVMSVLRERFAINGIEPRIFEGKACLDVGCGSGRGTVFMLRGGAQSVSAVDINPKLTESTRKWATHFGYANVEVRLASALKLPYADDSFDFVWCNGVLHRTEDPDQGLQEIARVLKPSGLTFLYILGSGGVYWHFLDWARGIFKGFDFAQAQLVMQWSGISKMDIACHADDWFNSYFRRYTRADLDRRLQDLGFGNVQRLAGRSAADTFTELLDLPESAKAFLGEGALRFLATKTGSPTNGFRLPDHAKSGSPYRDVEAVKHYEALYADIAARLEQVAPLRTAPAPWFVTIHSINQRLLTLTARTPFDDSAYRAVLADTAAAVDRFKTIL